MKHIVMGCLAGTGLLILALIGAAWFWLVREAPLLDAGLQCPMEAVVGSPFEMTITVSNKHERTIRLDSIDIDNAFLKGFQVISIKPEPTDTMSIPLVDQRSWSFGTPVRNRGTLDIVYTLKPVLTGNFTGDIDVCNPNQDFHTLLGQVVVCKASEATDAATTEADDD